MKSWVSPGTRDDRTAVTVQLLVTKSVRAENICETVTTLVGVPVDLIENHKLCFILWSLFGS